MEYTIKRGNSDILTVRPEGQWSRKLMGEQTVSFTFSLPSYVELRLGDMVTVFGEPHYLNRLPGVEKVSSLEYRYTCTFETLQYDLGKVAYLMLGDDNSLKEPDFHLMGNAEDFIDLLLQNMNRVQAGWSKGMVDSTEYKNLSFAKENCLQVLSKVAMEFNTEFWVTGKTIHLTKRGPISNLSFEYGKGNGLYQLTRQNRDGANVFTRLYAYGAARNLLNNYRNYANRLLLPEAAGPYLESNAVTYGVIEHVQVWEDIFPHRTGIVSAIGDMYTFYDAAMDFDVNAHLLPGEVAKVTFNTGQLAGFTFEISAYDPATKKFTFLPGDDPDLQVPTELLKPQPGDEYVLIDIFLPETYVTAAENELHTRALEYLTQNSQPRVSYAVTCDPLYFKRQGVYISLGSFVQVVDPDMGVDVSLRVVGLSRDVARGFAYKLELSEAFTIPAILRQYAQQDKISKFIARQEQLPPAPAPWQPVWQDVTVYTNGAAHFNPGVQYLKDPNGFVHLRGHFRAENNTAAFTLPAGFRPGRQLLTAPYNSRVQVKQDGVVSCVTGYSIFSLNLCSVEGITFLAEN